VSNCQGDQYGEETCHFGPTFDEDHQEILIPMPTIVVHWDIGNWWNLVKRSWNNLENMIVFGAPVQGEI